MYRGTNEELKRKIQEFNSNSPNWFIFSRGDLEPDYKKISGKIYLISSPELRQKFGEIITQRKTPEDNIYASPEYIEINQSTPTKLSPAPWDYGQWLIVKKRYIYQQARQSGGNLISLASEHENREWKENFTKGLGYIFGDNNYYYSPGWERIVENEEREIERKIEKWKQAIHLAYREIRDKAKLGNIELEEALEDEEYLQLQPDYCFCGDGSPEQQKEYWQEHIYQCLGSEEKITQFKNKIIEIIERSIANFNQQKKEIIEKAEQEIQTKGIIIDWGFWKEQIRKEKNKIQLEQLEKRINNLIQELVNLSEEQRKDKEKRVREWAEEEETKRENKEEWKKRREGVEKEFEERMNKLHKDKKQEEKPKPMKIKSSPKPKDIEAEKTEIDQKADDLKEKLQDKEEQEIKKLDDFPEKKKRQDKRTPEKIAKNQEDLKKILEASKKPNDEKVENSLTQSNTNSKNKKNKNNSQQTEKNNSSFFSQKRKVVNYSNLFLGGTIVVLLLILIGLLVKRKK